VRPLDVYIRADEKARGLCHVSVEELKEENDLRSSRIYPGQVLTIPSGG
jgi:hypothetical protein